MAHTCPDCGCVCYCGGDIDDIELPGEPEGGCIHFTQPECDGYEENKLYAEQRELWIDMIDCNEGVKQ